MEKLERYRALIKQQIRRYVESFSEGASSNVQELEVFDDERGHYQWVSLGWEKSDEPVSIFARHCASRPASRSITGTLMPGCPESYSVSVEKDKLHGIIYQPPKVSSTVVSMYARKGTLTPASLAVSQTSRSFAPEATQLPFV